jgi:plasmid maintenance system killer protein
LIRTFRTGGTRDIFEGRASRICFRWLDADAWDVEITDYH